MKNPIGQKLKTGANAKKLTENFSRINNLQNIEHLYVYGHLFDKTYRVLFYAIRRNAKFLTFKNLCPKFRSFNTFSAFYQRYVFLDTQKIYFFISISETLITFYKMYSIFIYLIHFYNVSIKLFLSYIFELSITYIMQNV